LSAVVTVTVTGIPTTPVSGSVISAIIWKSAIIATQAIRVPRVVPTTIIGIIPVRVITTISSKAEPPIGSPIETPAWIIVRIPIRIVGIWVIKRPDPGRITDIFRIIVTVDQRLCFLI
jgi:hypothetical protein